MEGCVSAKYCVASEYWFARLLKYGMDELPITLEYAWFSSTTSTTGADVGVGGGVGGGGAGGGGVGGGGVGGGGVGGGGVPGSVVVVAVWETAPLPPPPQPITEIVARVIANRETLRPSLKPDRMDPPLNYGTFPLRNRCLPDAVRGIRNAMRVPECSHSRCWRGLRVCWS